MSRFFWQLISSFNTEDDVNKRSEKSGIYGDTRSRVLYEPPAEVPHMIDFVFVHDARSVPDEEWGSSKPGDGEWPIYLSKMFPQARILIFQYDTSWVTSLDELVNPDRVLGTLEQFVQFLEDHDADPSPPFIVFAHGFGGLLYEQAVVQSQQSSEAPNPAAVFQRRAHTAFLFGTPHFGAGIAEWAIMLATRYGLCCAKTPQDQDWSELEDQMAKIAEMQTEFQQIIKSEYIVKTVGCFPTSSEPQNGLILSSEWAVLPEFMSIAVDSCYSSLTKLSPDDEPFKTIALIIPSLARELIQAQEISMMPKLSTSPAPSPNPPLKFVSSLASSISDNLATSVFDGKARNFLPGSCLFEILTTDAIRKELGLDSGGLTLENKDIVYHIRESARKLFATMVYSGISGRCLYEVMKSAENKYFGDSKLPVRDINSLWLSWPDIFKHLDTVEVNRFCENQWIFQAQGIDTAVFTIYRLSANHILPFISKISIKSDIYHRFVRYEMHRSYLFLVRMSTYLNRSSRYCDGEYSILTFLRQKVTGKMPPTTLSW
ncbi:hypothetical protein GGR51DRAFT_23259 [Nemania sp. FL0031]|nr:hypothetical protein GGR51DRAFT_23259 [Nemania sp. FL0031]